MKSFAPKNKGETKTFYDDQMNETTEIDTLEAVSNQKQIICRQHSLLKLFIDTTK